MIPVGPVVLDVVGLALILLGVVDRRHDSGGSAGAVLMALGAGWLMAAALIQGFAS